MTIVLRNLKNTIPMRNSIFTSINYNFQLATASQLDTLLYANYASRIMSPIANLIIKGDVATQAELTELASLILANFKNKWDRKLQLYNLDYNPIANYKDELTESIQKESSTSAETSSTDSNTKEYNSQNVRTDNISTGETFHSESSSDSDSSRDTYGFNSNAGVPSDSSTSEDKSDTDSETVGSQTGTVANEHTGTDTDLLTSDTSSKSGTDETVTRTSTHIGNIGNLTTQTLIEQERSLREWNIINEILGDVVNFLTLPIYN